MLFWSVPLVALLFLGACGQQAPKAEQAETEPLSVDRPANVVEEPGTAVRTAASPRPVADGRVSRLSPLTVEGCRLVEENREEGGWWKRSCNGVAGYRLEWTESDLRQGLTVLAPDGSRGEPRLSEVVANGAFNSLGRTVEWRGPNGGRPDAMIVRMNVADGAEPQRPDISNLAVVRLAAPTCVIAVVPPETRQNERAREIADGSLSKCVGD